MNNTESTGLLPGDTISKTMLIVNVTGSGAIASAYHDSLVGVCGIHSI